MFCKYCGKSMMGTICPACGKETILRQSSNELEKLMSSASNKIPEKTYQQGWEEGYQKGFSEGYSEGLISGQPPIFLMHKTKKYFAAICAVAFVAVGTICWSLSGNIHYKSGLEQGKTDGKNEAVLYYSEELEKRYLQGKEDAEKENGIEKENLISRIEELQFKLEQEETSLASYLMITESPPPEHNTIIYSREINSGSRANPSQVVKIIQSRLIELGYLKENADGIFGQNTESAVKAFQKDHDLPETGIVEENTYQLLFNATSEEYSAENTGFVETAMNTEAPENNELFGNIPEVTENSGETEELPASFENNLLIAPTEFPFRDIWR